MQGDRECPGRRWAPRAASKSLAIQFSSGRRTGRRCTTGRIRAAREEGPDEPPGASATRPPKGIGSQRANADQRLESGGLGQLPALQRDRPRRRPGPVFRGFGSGFRRVGRIGFGFRLLPGIPPSVRNHGFSMGRGIHQRARRDVTAITWRGSVRFRHRAAARSEGTCSDPAGSGLSNEAPGRRINRRERAVEPREGKVHLTLKSVEHALALSATDPCRRGPAPLLGESPERRSSRGAGRASWLYPRPGRPSHPGYRRRREGSQLFVEVKRSRQPARRRMPEST